ncbi:MAG: tRNA uridine-5-carboxymethylaminomethyl(34) synthesis GTPase MnmE [Spirochaetaceae bacterium]|nr:tRNA uridine-5-carboxymethylaminomethyl(34) synthesis GTPase MnmE [Spirochaetaceae bacterium]
MKHSLCAYSTEDCIAALATPWGQSALAIIRTSGGGALRRFAPAFSNPHELLGAAGRSLLHGEIRDPETAQTIDDVLVGVFRAGASYTGEEGVEIYCHGSLPGVRRILDLLRGLGFRDAQPGEFTFRAFCNGRMDLTQAEAVGEISSAQTDRSRSLALHRLSGGLAREIDAAKALLAETLAALEIRLDYPEEDSPDEESADFAEPCGRAAEILRKLLATYREGRLYREGAAVALAGRTNAGKSSLFNYLVKEERAIVSPQPGTTRDYIEALVSLAGIPVRLYDTAGLRDSRDPVEAEGVRRSRELLEAADLVLYLADAAAALAPEDDEALASLGGRALLVWNKIDIAPDHPCGGIPISARTGDGIAALTEEIEKRLAPGRSSGAEIVIESERQRDLLEKSLAALDRFIPRAKESSLDILAEDLREALAALGEITGEVTTEEMLGLMFSRFCVGK